LHKSNRENKEKEDDFTFCLMSGSFYLSKSGAIYLGAIA
jgi:hypothetical protein